MNAQASVHTLDHTGDVALRVHASQLDDLFVAAARGLLGILVDRPPDHGEQTSRVTLEADTREGLLVAWLDEILYLVQTRSVVPAVMDAFITETADGYRIEAELRLVPLDARAHGWHGEVKATTYHGLVVEERRDGWHADVVFDV